MRFPKSSDGGSTGWVILTLTMVVLFGVYVVYISSNVGVGIIAELKAVNSNLKALREMHTENQPTIGETRESDPESAAILESTFDPTFDMTTDVSGDGPTYNSLVVDLIEQPTTTAQVGETLRTNDSEPMNVQGQTAVFQGVKAMPDGQVRLDIQMGTLIRREIVHLCKQPPPGKIAGVATIGPNEEFVIFIYWGNSAQMQYTELSEVPTGMDITRSKPSPETEWHQLLDQFLSGAGIVVKAGNMMVDENGDPLLLGDKPVHYDGILEGQLTIRYYTGIGRQRSPIITELDIIPVDGGPKDDVAGKCKVGDRWILVVAAASKDITYFARPAKMGPFPTP